MDFNNKPFTVGEKYIIYCLAYEDIKNIKSFMGGACAWIRDVVNDNELYIGYPVSVYSMTDFFPEILKYMPVGADPQYLWFTIGDKQPRLNMLEKLINDCLKQM